MIISFYFSRHKIRISALNDSSDDESRSASKVKSSTKEAQESEALALYNQALSLLRQGDEDGARNTFLKLLEVQLVKEVSRVQSWALFGLVCWGLTPQQQPGSYQGGEMTMMKSVFWWRKPKYPEETTDLRQAWALFLENSQTFFSKN